MALRKIESFSSADGSAIAVVYRDAEWNEYRVKFFVDGSHLVEADYHDEDKASAIHTAESWIANRAHKPAECAFRALSLGHPFEFADPVGYSLGRTFVKVSPRGYEERDKQGLKPRFKVGTVGVMVKPL